MSSYEPPPSSPPPERTRLVSIAALAVLLLVAGVLVYRVLSMPDRLENAARLDRQAAAPKPPPPPPPAAASQPAAPPPAAADRPARKPQESLRGTAASPSPRPAPEARRAEPAVPPQAAPSQGAAVSETPAAPASAAPQEPATAERPYEGPTAGTLIWSGQIEKNTLVTINGDQVSFGRLTGELPGVPVTIEAPADTFAVVDQPGPAHHWKRFSLRSLKRVRTAVVIKWSLAR